MGDKDKRLVEAIPIITSLIARKFYNVPGHLLSREDLRQIGLLAVISGFHKWDFKNYAWPVFVIMRATHGILDELRKIRNHLPLYEWDTQDPLDEYQLLEDKEECEQLIAALLRFAEEREVQIMLKLQAGDKQFLIAEQMGMSEASVSRTIKKLAKRLKEIEKS